MDAKEKIYNDRLAVIWALHKLKWSWRRIARIQLPRSHHTVSAYYQWACELEASGELPIFDKGKKKELPLLSVGDTNDVEYFDAEINHNYCKGGKRTRPHKYNSDYREHSQDD